MSPETLHEELSLGERITEAISVQTLFTVRLGAFELPITDSLVGSWVVILLLSALAYFGTRKLRPVPGRLQAGLEAFVEFIYKFAEDTIGHHGRAYAPFIGTLGLFILCASLTSLFSPVGAFGFEPPFIIRPVTRDINIPAALALLTISIVLVSSIRYKGVGGWIRSLVRPAPFMLPFNLMEYLIRPLSLSLRLFGNILGAYIIMLLGEAVLPFGLPPILALYFELFDAAIQSVVFTYLATVFIAEAVEQH